MAAETLGMLLADPRRTIADTRVAMLQWIIKASQYSYFSA
jgi:hypothetical protein